MSIDAERFKNAVKAYELKFNKFASYQSLIEHILEIDDEWRARNPDTCPPNKKTGADDSEPPLPNNIVYDGHSYVMDGGARLVVGTGGSETFRLLAAHAEWRERQRSKVDAGPLTPYGIAMRELGDVAFTEEQRERIADAMVKTILAVTGKA